MAELKANTTLGGKAIWGASNLPFIVKDKTLEYKGFKVYTEHDKPTPTEINAYTKQEADLKLDGKVDKVTGKGLSEVDFTSQLNDKLETIEEGAQKNIATNLVFLTTETEGSLQSTTGNTVQITQASTTKAGLISSADKVKLNSLPSGTSGIIPLTGGGTGAATASGARTNLQLGNAATHNYGTAVNTIAQGNDPRIVNAANKTETENSLNLKADKSIKINTTNGLLGGGDLSTDRTISITYGTAVNTVAQGNDSRINNGQLAFNRLDIGATAATARTALQLGNTATHNYGTTNNSIMQGNDARVLAAATKTELTDGLALKADKSINISVGAGLFGGGTLAANRTINLIWGTTLNTVPQGNDQRILNGQLAFNRLDIGATAATARTALQLGNTATHNYGYDANTIAQGNDSRIVNGQTSFEWGDHSLAGYIKSYVNTTYTAGTGLTLTGTVFSSKYGTAAGTAAEGNDQRILNGQLAFNRLDIGATAATARTTLGIDNFQLMTVATNGDLTGSRNGSFNDVYIRSDIRDKKDIKPIKDALIKINKLSGNTYNIAKVDGYYPSAGIIAQELLEVLPESVTDNGKRLDVSYSGVTALLVAAVKELSHKVSILENKYGG